MKNKIIVFVCVVAFIVTMVGCGKEEESTVTGMVVSVDGTKVSLQEFDGEMPDMESFEGKEGFENFNPENFNPEDFNAEDFNPEDFDGTMSELPEGAEVPEMPADGSMPDFGSQFSDGESTTIDLADAHITVEFDGGKATGSMEDITKGSFLTITLDKKGEATNVVVSSMSDFGRESSGN